MELNLFESARSFPPLGMSVFNAGVPAWAPDLDSYDRIVIFYSGGKDGAACLLHLLELGVPSHKIELHHHAVDGLDADGQGMFDWPCTGSYIEAVGQAFGIPVFVSYREGGIERESLRVNAPTAPVHFMKGDGTWGRVGGTDRSPLGTRLKFPAVSADLRVRWCSSVAKISCADALLRNDDRFRDSRTLAITGERAEESANRARYAAFEPHRSDARDGRLKRHIDHWRPVHQWDEIAVWEIIRRYSLDVHPAYRNGFSRASCLGCVFGDRHQWATIRKIAPAMFWRIAQREIEFGYTIKNGVSVIDLADAGTPYECEPGWDAIAMSPVYLAPVFASDWTLPVGAFGGSAGPS